MAGSEENSCSKFILNSELIYLSENKHLMTDTKGNSSFVSSRPPIFLIIEDLGEKNRHCFPWSRHEVFCYSNASQLKKKT